MMKNFEELEKFINDNNNWVELLQNNPYNIKVTQSQTRPNLYILKYNQYSSDFSNPIVCQCRGTVIKYENGKGSIYCAPYIKFFNYNEELAADINWKTAKCREKIDGWLIKGIVLPDHGIEFFSNGSFIENGYYKFPDDTLLLDLIVKAIEDVNKINDINIDSGAIIYTDWAKNLEPGTTLLFELTSKQTKIIVSKYSSSNDKPKLWFHGIRDSRGNEHHPEDFKDIIPFEIPRQYDFKDIKSILNYLESWSGKEHEGIVVCDDNFNRIKIKCSDYLRLKYVLDYEELLQEEKNVWNIYMSDEMDDLIGVSDFVKDVFKNFEVKLEDFKIRYLKFVKKEKLNFKKYDNRKDIASFIKIEIPECLQPVCFNHINSDTEEDDIRIMNDFLQKLGKKKDMGYKTFHMIYETLEDEKM